MLYIKLTIQVKDGKGYRSEDKAGVVDTEIPMVSQDVLTSLVSSMLQAATEEYHRLNPIRVNVNVESAEE